jgi:hypothetical protein
MIIKVAFCFHQQIQVPSIASTGMKYLDLGEEVVAEWDYHAGHDMQSNNKINDMHLISLHKSFVAWVNPWRKLGLNGEAI